MKPQRRRRLGDILISSGLITDEQLDVALTNKQRSQKLGEALIEQGFISEQQLIQVLEFQLGVPHVNLYNYTIDKAYLSLVPKEVAKRNFIIPLKIEDDKLFVAMADPMDFYTIDDLRLSTGYQIERVIATKDDISKAITKYYGFEDSMSGMEETEVKSAEVEESDLTGDEAPIVRLVNQILLNAAQQKASDVHIDPQETTIVIRYRIDGILRTEKNLSKSMQNVLISRVKIMSNLNITENRVPQDGRIKVRLEGHHIDIRVSTLPTVFGEKVVLRLLDLGNAQMSLDKMGLHEINHQRFMQAIEKPTGIVLITGPTGSGKSSTLYAALNHLNSEDVNIITVEDPVEYQLQGINQIQVNPNVGLTFASGLRAILRQDPNIIMIGEIRDKETAEIAVRASLTGHLVLSTLHTNDSISSINRLTDMGVEPFLVASSVSGIMAQRLVRRICRECQQEQPVTEREKEIFHKRGIQIDKIVRGKGCGSCNMTGYKGRLAIHEILVVDEGIRRMIMNNQSLPDIKEYAIQNDIIFLIDDGLMKVKQGLTTTEEILRVAVEE